MGVFTFNNLMAAIQSHGLTESFLLPMIHNMSITGSLTILFATGTAGSEKSPQDFFLCSVGCSAIPFAVPGVYHYGFLPVGLV